MKITANRYRRHIERMQDRGNYFQFFRDYVVSGMMNKVEALFIQDLINLASMERKESQLITVDGEEYFLCTVQYLQESLLWTDAMQTRLLKSLKDKGYIKVVKTGLPPRRYICILHEVLMAELDEWEDDSINAKCGDRSPQTNFNQRKMIATKQSKCVVNKEEDTSVSSPLKEKKKKRTLIPDNSTLKSTNGSDIDRKLALSLHDGLLAKNKIVRDVGPVQLGKWAKHFTELRKYRTVKEIQTAIDFHVLHIGENYHPDYRSAKKFCSLNPDEGFIKIEAAMERAANKHQKKEEERDLGW